MNKTIAISLSPNTQKDDVLLAVKLLFSPWFWFNKNYITDLESKFAELFGKEYKALAVNSGRSAEQLILEALGIAKDDEVILQAFTCVAVPNAISWLGAKPVYIDVDDSFNLDPLLLNEKIHEKTKAIIIQHTFGIPANLDKISKIAKKHKIYLIEDCAHSLGGTYAGRLLGTLGDMSFFSFGRDKVLSSIFGGMILCKDGKYYDKIKTIRDSLPEPNPLWIFQQLLHPIIFSIILPLYNFGFRKLTLGKILLFSLQKLKLLSFPVYNKEKEGKKVKYFPGKMPAALAILASRQLTKLDSFNKQREIIANIYFEGLKDTKLILPQNNRDSIWLRFPVIINNAHNLYKYAKKHGILLGRWYKKPVDPAITLSLFGYDLGSCPKAEEYSEKIINLPTYPVMTVSDAEKVIKVVKQWLNSK